MLLISLDCLSSGTICPSSSRRLFSSGTAKIENDRTISRPVGKPLGSLLFFSTQRRETQKCLRDASPHLIQSTVTPLLPVVNGWFREPIYNHPRPRLFIMTFFNWIPAIRFRNFADKHHRTNMRIGFFFLTIKKDEH